MKLVLEVELMSPTLYRCRLRGREAVLVGIGKEFHLEVLAEVDQPIAREKA